MRHCPSLVAIIVFALSACVSDDKPQRRTRSTPHDTECRQPERPSAFMYPATNREFGPDNPKTDNCELAVPDHLFCCPNTPKPTDR